MPNPTYEQVSAETTGHAESVEVVYDAAQISYAKLLDAYWHDIDPVAVDQQFCDIGSSYRSAIFYHDSEQQRLAEASKQALGRLPCALTSRLSPRSWRPACLSGRGISSKILSEESRALCRVPRRVRT